MLKSLYKATPRLSWSLRLPCPPWRRISKKSSLQNLIVPLRPTPQMTNSRLTRKFVCVCRAFCARYVMSRVEDGEDSATSVDVPCALSQTVLSAQSDE
eukprot:3863806-Amphidinium_carterae.1